MMNISNWPIHRQLTSCEGIYWQEFWWENMFTGCWNFAFAFLNPMNQNAVWIFTTHSFSELKENVCTQSIYAQVLTVKCLVLNINVCQHFCRDFPLYFQELLSWICLNLYHRTSYLSNFFLSPFSTRMDHLHTKCTETTPFFNSAKECPSQL